LFVILSLDANCDHIVVSGVETGFALLALLVDMMMMLVHAVSGKFKKRDERGGMGQEVVMIEPLLSSLRGIGYSLYLLSRVN